MNVYEILTPSSSSSPLGLMGHLLPGLLSEALRDPPLGLVHPPLETLLLPLHLLELLLQLALLGSKPLLLGPLGAYSASEAPKVFLVLSCFCLDIRCKEQGVGSLTFGAIVILIGRTRDSAGLSYC